MCPSPLETQGDLESPIWLIGDSDPNNENTLSGMKYVFDEKYPVIHNIWTPIIYRIQKKIYMDKNKILDDIHIYKINAIEDPNKRKNKNHLYEFSQKIKKLIYDNNPKIIITFGFFAYKFIFYSINTPDISDISKFNLDLKYDKKKYNNSKICYLKDEFEQSIKSEKIIIPLLHNVVSQRFRDAHENFSGKCENYFDFVADNLWSIFLKAWPKEWFLDNNK
jgi:hypothetical protein